MSEPARPEASRSEAERLLEGLRAESAAPPRRGRIAFAIVVGAVAVAVGSSATLAASAASGTDERGLAAPQATDAAKAAVPTPTATVEPTAAAGASDPALVAKYHTSRFAYPDPIPLYDATTDISEIPPMTPDQELVLGASADSTAVIEEDLFIAKCMAERGFEYTFTPYWLAPKGYAPVASPTESDDWNEALTGAADQPSGEDYDWRQAGCAGAAQHEFGTPGH